jgi:hypothetical protein
MSPSRDFPLYEVMKKRSPRAARWWIAGDRLYHVGLAATVICIPALFYAYSRRSSPEGWAGWIGWFALALVASVALFALGIYCKRESYRIAMQAGIDINRF